VNANLQEQAWKYFELHAHQRLTIFNFYIALCSAISAGLVATFAKEFGYPGLRILFGLLLILFSFVFLKLDERAKLLIKNADEALKFLRCRMPATSARRMFLGEKSCSREKLRPPNFT
jgi:hypothetical protein